jgi:hypothetical protein
MKKSIHAILLSILAFIIFTPMVTAAAVTPTDKFILYKNNKPIANLQSVIYSCDLDESDNNGGYFRMEYCGYSGSIEKGKTTIYQVTNNQSQKITNPGPFTPPAKDYLLKLKGYYATLVKTATKSKTIDIQSPDGIAATTEDRYYSVDIDTGSIKYLQGDEAKLAKGTENTQKLPVYVISALIFIFALTLFFILWAAWKRHSLRK